MFSHVLQHKNRRSGWDLNPRKTDLQTVTLNHTRTPDHCENKCGVLQNRTALLWIFSPTLEPTQLPLHFFCGCIRIRTENPLIKSQMLYQLELHTQLFFVAIEVFELPTFSL